MTGREGFRLFANGDPQAGFEPEVKPNLSADLHKGIERLQVPLGSGEITWRHLKSLRFGPKLAPEARSAPTGMPTRWGRMKGRSGF
jgi:hypothetical protein